jgi:hypothetical protein
MNCERCGEETTITTMSFFNTDIVCMECNDLEKQHPGFAAAHEADQEEVAKGNYNFKGVGLPEGYTEWARTTQNT